MSSISELTSVINQASTTQIRSRPDPTERFKELDSNGNGTLDTVELSDLAKKIAEDTGSTVDLTELIAQYDNDQDGELNQDEMDSLMKALGPPPQEPPQGISSDVWHALQAYLTNAEDSRGSLSVISGQQDTVAPPPPPEPEDIFNELDSDGSSGLSQSELEAMAEGFAAETGIQIDTEEALANYDTDEDGELSFDEMDTMMMDLHEKNSASENPLSDQDLERLIQQYRNGSDEERLSIIETLFGDDLAA